MRPDGIAAGPNAVVAIARRRTSLRNAALQEEAWAPELWEGESLAVGGAPPSPRFRGTIKRDSAGNSYTILPQPVLKPKMVKPE